MKAGFKIVSINIIILFILVFISNVLSYFLVDSFIFSSPKTIISGAERYRLISNNKTDEYNKLVFKEFYQLETDYEPYIVWSRKKFNGKTITINSEGDRIHPCFDCDNKDSSIITRFFGGSSTWGTGVDDQGTIPYFYNERNKTEVVFNHGESGYVSRQNLARLINIINQNKKTSKVIFYDGWNDITELCRADVSINSHNRALKINEHIKRSNNLGSSKELILLSLERVFIFYTKELIKNIKGKNKIRFFDNDDNNICCSDVEIRLNVVKTLINNWSIAKNIVEENGGEFFAILQPSAFTGNNIFHKDYKISRADCMKNIYNQMCEMIREELGEKEWFLDLTYIFNDKGPYYFDGVHVNDIANEMIAIEIDNFIK